MKVWCAGLVLGALTLSACGGEAAEPPPTAGDANQEIQDIWDLPGLQPVEPGTYFMDPDLDASTPLRVVYDIPFEGWSQWAGTYKEGADNGHVGVTITTVDNLVTDGCTNHYHADPPIGPSVDDLASALADLAPFEVTSPPEEVTAYGYDGIHLEWMVPDLPVEQSGDGLIFSECGQGEVRSWVAPFDHPPDDAFYGYTGPGYTEEFWILDVDGTRLMIAAERSAGSSEQDLDEQQAILDSIRIEP
jgi:hypothetical protein